jgi:hypothetical protein
MRRGLDSTRNPRVGGGERADDQGFPIPPQLDGGASLKGLINLGIEIYVLGRIHGNICRIIASMEILFAHQTLMHEREFYLRTIAVLPQFCQSTLRFKNREVFLV